MFGTTATNSSKGSMSMNHLLASPKQHQHRDHSSMLDTSSLPFNFAQMTGVNSNGLPGFPPFGFDPSNPISKNCFFFYLLSKYLIKKKLLNRLLSSRYCLFSFY